MDFKSVATKMKDDIERPPLPPAGNYLWQIPKIPTVSESKDHKWDIVEYQVKAVGVVSDVDEGALNEFGGIKNIRNRVSFMFDKEDETSFKNTEFNHKRFLTEHVRCWEDGMNVTQAMNASVNKQFVGTIGWKQDKNDQEVFHANISKTAPVSA